MDIEKLHARERRIADDITQGIAARARLNKQRPFSRPKRDDVRASILQAAADVFLDEGYERASLARIATRAGFTKGAIYSNFGSKTELFMEIWEAQIRKRTVLVETLIGVGQQTKSTDELLDSLSLTLVQYIPQLQPWEILIAQMRMLARNNEEISRLYTRVFNERIDNIVHAARDYPPLDSLTEAQLRAFALALISLINMLCLEKAAQTDFQSEKDTVDLFRYCLQGVLA